MSGVVLAETPAITEAILEASPATSIAEVCEGQLNSSIFNGLTGGFVGSMLLNITTAALAYMREQPGEPIIERPVAYASEARSFVGRLAISLLNQSLEAAGQDTTTYTPMGYEHFCNRAEDFYADESVSTSYPQGKPSTVVLDHEKNVILYGKSMGEPTALLVEKGGMTINGIWLPAGFICAYTIENQGDAIRHSDDRFFSIDNISGISPYRISAFAIPQDERDETFKIPSGRTLAGLSPHKLLQYGSMEFMRQSFNQKASGPRLSLELHRAGLISQPSRELSLAAS